MEIAFFGHDAADAAIAKRVRALQAAGHEVTGYMMRRGDAVVRAWPNVDLGQTFDGQFFQRLQAIGQGVARALAEEARLRQASLIYARNLDMLICAVRVRDRLKISTPIIYECLDVHHLLSGDGIVSLGLRALERHMLRRTCLLVYSSPAFEREYFSRYCAGLYRPYLLENKLLSDQLLPPRSTRKSLLERDVLRIGWFGVLRCARSLSLLAALAAQYPKRVEIILRGQPAASQVPNFDAVVAAHDNMVFHGAYEAPQDLAKIYEGVDLVWAGDFYQAGYNSKWLLPNRLYEGGNFATPAIAPVNCETGNWVSRHESGFVVPEPLDVSLPVLLNELLARPEAIRERVNNLLALPDEVFIQPENEMAKLLIAAGLSDRAVV